MVRDDVHAHQHCGLHSLYDIDRSLYFASHALAVR